MTSSASPLCNLMLVRPCVSISSRAPTTPSRKGSAPMMPTWGFAAACAAMCSPRPKPISSHNGRSSPNSRIVSRSPVAGTESSGSRFSTSADWPTRSLCPVRRPYKRRIEAGSGRGSAIIPPQCRRPELLESTRVLIGARSPQNDYELEIIRLSREACHERFC